MPTSKSGSEHVARTGVATAFQMTGGNYNGDVFGVDAGNSLQVTQPRIYLPALSGGGLRLVAGVTAEVPLQPHFAPEAITYTLRLSGEMQRGGNPQDRTNTFYVSDDGWISNSVPFHATFPYDYSQTDAVLVGGIPSNVPLKSDMQAIYGRSGYRSCVAELSGLAIQYTEHVPGYRGGRFVNIIDLVSEWGPGVIVSGDSLFVNAGSDMPIPAETRWAMMDGNSQFNERGEGWESGIIYRVTLLDYGMKTPLRPGQSGIISLANGWQGFLLHRVSASSDLLGDVSYYCSCDTPASNLRIGINAGDLDWAQVRVEIYCGLPVPPTPPFWADFQRASEIIEDLQ